MSDVLLYAILGLGAGSAYSLLGIGVVVIYKGSGVINFAQGSIAILSALITYLLRSHGTGTALAIIGGLASALAAGALIYLLVMRPLRTAPMLAKNVATLGILLLVLASIPLLYKSISAAALPQFLPSASVEFASISFGRDRLYLLLIAVVVTGILAGTYRWTRFGLSTRAVSESEFAASILGFSPGRIGLLNWMLGAGLAGLAGVLIAPISGLDPTAMTFLVVPTLAAALIGNFASFGLTLGGGLFIGILQSLCLRYGRDITGLADALPLLLIVLVMAVRSRALPARDVLVRGRPPQATEGRFRLWYVVVTAVIVVFVAPQIESQYVYAAQTSFCLAIVFLSQTIITGYVGQISLAQLSFTGLGVLFASRFATGMGLPFPLPILLTGVVAIPIGIVLGLPAVRVRGINLAVVTLAMAAAVYSFVFGQARWTGGPGISIMPNPTIFGIDLNAVQYPQRYLIVTFVFLVAAAAATVWIRRSRLGRQFLSVRENERAAAALGINVWRTKLVAFSIAAAMAGMAGALLAYQSSTVAYDPYAASNSVTILAQSYILGVGSVFGALLAGIFANGGVFTALLGAAFSSSIAQWVPVVSGVLLILTVIQNPDGVVPLMSRQIRGRRSRKSPRQRPRGTATVAAAADAEETTSSAVKSWRSRVSSSRHPAVGRGGRTSHDG